MPIPDLLHSLQRAAAMRGAHKDTQAAGWRQPVRALAVPWADTVYWGYVHPMRAYDTNTSAVPRHKGGGDMHRKWVGFTGMLVAVLLVAALAAQAQPREVRPGFAPDRPRGIVIVNNDWQDQVNLSMWSNNRERIGEWIIRPGQNAVLQEGGATVKARPNYKIKAGEDWGWVDLGQVGRFQQGNWYVNIRDVWRATHRQRAESFDQRRSEIPDWRR